SKNARVAGLLYILASAVGIVRLMYIPNTLFVRGDATATANNIAAHESLFRWGIASELVASALWLLVPLALYRLLKEVDQTLADGDPGQPDAGASILRQCSERRGCPAVGSRRFPLGFRQAAALRFRQVVPQSAPPA